MPISLEADPSLAQGYIKVNGTTAATLTASGIVSGGIPAGAILPFAMNSAPAGWLACSGQEVAIADYGALSTAIYVGDGSNADTDLVYGFKTNGSGTRTTAGTYIKLPDLRGEFVRGWDNARGIDSSRKNRSYQADEFKSHTHDVVARGNSATGNFAAGSFPVNAQTLTTTATGGVETRPRNVTALYCIKF
jgi:microcystin-dependent protein